MSNKNLKNIKKEENNQLPIVYIILPVYNCEKYFLEQLMSIYYQNYENRFLIIVNDWSTDSSLEIAKDFVIHYKLEEKVKIITKENGWVNSAMTKWFEELKKITNLYSDNLLVAYCDSDDVWSRDKLAVQVDFMLNNSDCDLSYHDTIGIDQNWILINPSLHRTAYHDDSFFYLSTISAHMWSTEMVFRPGKYIDKILPMPTWPWMYQDYRTSLVISLLGWKFCFIDKKLGSHRYGHASLTYQAKKLDTNGWVPYFTTLQERFPDKDISYIVSYRKYKFDIEKKWTSVVWLSFMTLFKYPKVFFLWLKAILYKIFRYGSLK